MKRRKPLRLDDVAEADIDHAVDYYEAQRKGLGAVFQATVLAALNRIAELPDALPLLMKSRDGLVVRGASMRPFNHRVVFVVLPGALRVVAVAHNARGPDFLLDRLGRARPRRATKRRSR